jgi:hypothetical protein
MDPAATPVVGARRVAGIVRSAAADVAQEVDAGFGLHAAGGPADQLAP